jgi:acetyl-CoA acetyltransferase
VVGIGATDLRRKDSRRDTELVVAACRAALEDAGIEPYAVDGINVQSHHSPAPDVAAVVREMGLKRVTWAPEGGIGVPGLAAASQAILTGRSTTALVCKVMNIGTSLNQPVVDPGTHEVGGRDQFELPYGLGYTVQRAGLVQRRWTASRRVTPEQLGTLCVVQREHAMLNENAVFRSPLTLTDYLESRVICDPIRLYDCDYPVGGAYAYLLAADPAVSDPGRAVAVRGWTSGQADDMPHIRDEGQGGIRPDIQQLYSALGISAQHLSAFMLYDGFSYLAAQWLEYVGVAQPAAVGPYIGEAANLRFDGPTPLNTHGGQLSEGRMHAAGHLLEAVRQLRGEAGRRQVRDAERVIVSTAFPPNGAVAILERRQ